MLTSIKKLLKNRLCILFYYFESLWKSLLTVVFQKWTILLKWTNLRKTAFQDLIKYLGFCLVGCLYLNKWFDEWENFWIVIGGWGFFMLFEALAGGAFDHLNYRRNLTKNFQKSQMPGVLRKGSMGGFRICQYKMQITDCCRPLFSPRNQNETKIVPLIVF